MGRMGQRFSKTSCVHIRIRTHRLLIFIRPTAPSAPKLTKTQDFFIMNKPKYNPEMQLSENFRLKEFIESPTAERLGIDNRPDWEAVINLRNLCREVLQPLRDHEGKPIHINSGYRCPELNEAVHGVGDSQHLRGEAADIHLPDVETGRRWYKYIVDNLDFDQLLFEYRRTAARVSAGCTFPVAVTARVTATWRYLTFPQDRPTPNPFSHLKEGVWHAILLREGNLK